MPLTAALFVVMAASNVHVAAVGFKAVSVDAQKAGFLTDYFSDQLGKAGRFPVTTPAQVSAIIGQERQKELLGCSDSNSTSCLAEIAGAIGTDALITGSIARIGTQFAIEVKITKSQDASQIASASDTLDREEQLLPWLKDRAGQMAPLVRAAFGLEPIANEHPLRSKAFIPFIAGGLLLGAAGVSHQAAQGIQTDLSRADSPYTTRPQVDEAVRRGELFNGVTVGTAVAGAAALALGAAFVLWPASDDGVTASVSVAPGTAAVSLGGSF